jgi:hypothetical protein
MESIEITNEHKDKLLEMCNVLFPKIYFTFRVFPTVGVSNGDLCYYLTPESNKRQYIHWFEFCMTHLVEKLIFNKKNNQKVHDDFREFFYSVNNYFIKTPLCIHPIEYLYNNFKQQKNGFTKG